MSQRISATLVLNGNGKVACAACSEALVPKGTAWKPAARLEEKPMQGVAGAPYTTGKDVLLRQFYCPACGALLDTESALPGDPFLNDVVEP